MRMEKIIDILKNIQQYYIEIINAEDKTVIENMGYTVLTYPNNKMTTFTKDNFFMYNNELLSMIYFDDFIIMLDENKLVSIQVGKNTLLCDVEDMETINDFENLTEGDIFYILLKNNVDNFTF